jgi:uncharacterized protein Yka (UPF0111/DUF47 family)
MSVVSRIFAKYEAQFGKPVDRFTRLELLKLQDEITNLQKEILKAQKAIGELKLFTVVKEVK